MIGHPPSDSGGLQVNTQLSAYISLASTSDGGCGLSKGRYKEDKHGIFI